MKKSVNVSLYHSPALLGKVFAMTLFQLLFVGSTTIYFSYFIDSITDSISGSQIGFLFFCYVFLQSLTLVGNYSYNIGFAHVRESLTVSMRESFLDAIFTRLTPKIYHRIGKSQLSSILLNDMKTLRDKYYASQISLLRNTLRLTLFCGIMFYYDVRVGFAIMATIGCTFASHVLADQVMGEEGLQYAIEKEVYLNNYRDEMYSRDEYRFAGDDSLLSDKLHHSNEKLEKAAFHFGKIQVWVSSLQELLQNITRCVLYGLEIWLVLRGEMTIGRFVSSISVLSLVQDEVSDFLRTLRTLSSTKGVRNRIWEILSVMDEGKCLEETQTMKDNWLCFGMENISFGYEENYVLRNVSFRFYRGAKYVLSGANGAGKSTLLHVLLGWESDYQGNLIIDDIKLPMGSLTIASCTAYVEQNFHLFSGTVADNIFFGDPERKNTLDASGFLPILQRCIPDLTKKIEDNGGNLSGGQRQVIGIARALSLGMPILILDESFSAADEALFEECLQFLRQEKDTTVILVSHRSHAFDRFGTILELSGGRIYEKSND